jgi:hypothetical protein
MPSTRISRLSFLIPSSLSVDAFDLDEYLGWLRILLNEWAMAAGDDIRNVQQRDLGRRALLPLDSQVVKQRETQSTQHQNEGLHRHAPVQDRSAD